MHIVVCMKQVPRDNSVKINPDLSINAEGIEQIMNLFDEYAVEEALEWNEKVGGKVTILSLGPAEWKEQIRRARALGWPQLTYVGKVVEVNDGAKKLVVERHLEEQVETVEAPLPAVVTVVKDLNEPRYPSLLRIKRV